MKREKKSSEGTKNLITRKIRGECELNSYSPFFFGGREETKQPICDWLPSDTFRSPFFHHEGVNMGRCRENVHDYTTGLKNEGLDPAIALLMGVIQQAVVDGLEIKPRFEAYESIKGKRNIDDQKKFKIKKEYGESVSAIRFLLSNQLNFFMQHFELDSFIKVGSIKYTFKKLLGRGYEQLLQA